jgi:hypothetical protein
MAKNLPKSQEMVHVYSTLATPQAFTTWKAGGGDIPLVDRQVVIKGGAGVATKNLLTPIGVHTAITVDDYDAIKDHPRFVRLIGRGHIRVEKKRAYDIESVVSDMNPADPGGPLTPADYAAVNQDGKVPIPVTQEKAGSGWVLPRG